ncbi:MAG: PHB depolymerase family esterase [Agarilytica sp.]
MKTNLIKHVCAVMAPVAIALAVFSSSVANAQARLTGTGSLEHYDFDLSLNRTYEVYIPQSYDGTPVPMIMALHGCVMNNIDAINAWNLDLIADQHNVILVFPYRGTIESGSPRSDDCWGYWFSQHISEGAGEPKYIYDVAREVESRYSIDPERRFLTGISSGAAMVIAEAVAYNDYWAAAAPVAGLPYGDWASSVISDPALYRPLSYHVDAINAELSSSTPVPMLVVQSSNDTTVNPPSMGLIRDSQLSVWANDLNADGTASCSRGGVSCTLTDYDDGSGNLIVRTMVYSGGPGREATYGSGHYWAGGDADMTVWSDDPNGPNASEQMWSFFEEVAGESYNPACESDTIAPSAPTGLAVSSVSGTSVVLSVNANGEADLRGYRVYQTGGQQLTLSVVSSTSITLSNLPAETQLSVYATALDTCGNESSASSSVSITTGVPPVVIPSVVSTVTDHYIAGRLSVNQYVEYGAKYGYNVAVDLWQVNGTWTDEDPNGNIYPPVIPPINPPINPGTPGAWQTDPTLAGTEVHYYTPSGTTANGKRALMISLHGCDYTFVDPNEIVKNNWGWQDEADEYGMVIAAPYVPDGGAQGLQCWDYYGTSQTRSNKHNDNLIELATTLIANTSLNIDPDQVYLSGLSSGGGQTFVTGCLAPDIFAGIGISAGPALGTSANQIGSVPFGTDPISVARICESLAGGYSSSFDTQIASVVHGDADTFVDDGYAAVDAGALAIVYDVSKDAGTNSISGGGTEETWSDSEGVRVSNIMVRGLAHAWPAGNDESGGSYTDHSTIDYPAFLSKFLFDNNRRAEWLLDSDQDGVPDAQDNCPNNYNPDQLDQDGDGVGDVCDNPIVVDDRDNDGVSDVNDNCPDTYNPDQSDRDNDGQGDACEGDITLDTDGDGVDDVVDNCPSVANSNQEDSDRDGLGNACDDTPNGPDGDGDGVADTLDNCPGVSNPSQADSDGDGIGDACDEPEGSCEDETAYNYYHKVYGRAHSSGSFMSPNYFSQGGEDAMAGSTWGFTTLHSVDGGSNWFLGACP